LVKQIDNQLHYLNTHINILRDSSPDSREEAGGKADPQERDAAAVAKLLCRPELTNSEMILVCYMRRHGKKPEAMARILGDLNNSVTKPGHSLKP
jgi:hypothetical protein